MNAVVERLRAAAEAGSSEPTRDITAGEAVLARVRSLARRRLAWLEHVRRGQEGEGPSPSSELLAVLEDRDHPEAERRWIENEPSLLALNQEISTYSSVLAADTESPLARLVKVFGLSDAERDLLHVCLALELDPGLAGTYAYLQQRERPYATAVLAARLCGWPREPLIGAGDGLTRWEIVRASDAALGEPPALRLDPHIVDFACHRFRVDPDLAGVAHSIAAVDALPTWPVTELVERVSRALGMGTGVRLILVGPRGSGRRSLAGAIARALGSDPLAVDTSAIADADWPSLHLRVQRQAHLFGMSPVWYGEGVSRRWPTAPSLAPVQFVVGDVDFAPAAAAGLVDERIAMPRLDIDERRTLWRRLVPASQAWPPEVLTGVSERYRLEVGDIAAIGKRGVTEVREARELCRAATRDRLGELAQLLDCPFERADLVLPAALDSRLDEFLFEARERVRFWENRSVRRLFPRGTGLVALMTGSPGTGKTMATQVIAAELGLDLFRIDLATCVSKYIGETAKHLKRIFARAAEMNAVLLFDEADALFTKRTEVRDAHDRYANTDTNYLLQLLEDFDGVALLSSNKRQNMDSAFVRRLRYILDFPPPTPRERRLLWQRFVLELAGEEAAANLRGGYERLADVLEATGAQIKLAVLAGVFSARQEGVRLGFPHIDRGITRELAKEGRGISPVERERIGSHA